MSLGSIFEPRPDVAARGADLVYAVTLNAADLDRADGVRVAVPRRLASVDGQVLERGDFPGEQGDWVTLRPPTDVPYPVCLRLRGAGAVGAEGRGDLLLTVHVGDVPALSGGATRGPLQAMFGPNPALGVAIAAVVVIGLGFLLFFA
ncbi:MAG: hypothetical protein H6700_08025 [Myxococcales bacterium]|nr:hypothetical protein [Myxococcales bacterium]MCB9531699.1 hypothetical protein [Myxococcales bacterium]